jgi:hypothetical protein
MGQYNKAEGWQMIELNPEFKEMMCGGVGEFDRLQLQEIFQRQNELNINTIFVQKSGERFWCRVDELTSNYWHEQKGEMKEEGQI